MGDRILVIDDDAFFREFLCRLLAAEGHVTARADSVAAADAMALGAEFDLVFLDPPYQEGAAKVAIEAIFTLGLLADQGRVFLEHAEKLPPTIETPLARLKQTKRYGTCAISIYEKNDEAKPD